MRVPRQGLAARAPAFVILGLLILPSVTATVGLAYFLIQRHLPAGRATRAPDSSAPGSHPPWTYGRADARFTIIEYTDLECPYCRTYFPVLQRLVAEHPEVNWQWHHLPLSVHEPAATQAARLAECAGEARGNAAFWNAVAWIYENTRGNGEGLPADARLPGMSPAIEACMASTRPNRIIKAQADAAAGEQIAATPTLQVLDRKTGKTLTLQGLIDGDALLSAFDLVSAPSAGSQEELDRRASAKEPASSSSSVTQ